MRHLEQWHKMWCLSEVGDLRAVVGGFRKESDTIRASLDERATTLVKLTDRHRAQIEGLRRILDEHQVLKFAKSEWCRILSVFFL